MSSYHVDKWCRGRGVLLTRFVKLAVEMPAAVVEMVQLVRSGDCALGEPAAIDPVEWVSLYDSPDRICQSLEDGFGLPFTMLQQLSAASDDIDMEAILALGILPEDAQRQVAQMVLAQIEAVLEGMTPEGL